MFQNLYKNRSVIFLISISLVSMLTYVFGQGELDENSFQYFDKRNSIKIGFTFPQRYYFIAIIFIFIFIDILLRKTLFLPRELSLRIYLLFLIFMSISFVFDSGVSWSYNVGFLLMAILVIYLKNLSNQQLLILLKSTAVMLGIYLILRNYFYPPVAFNLQSQARYGAGINPNAYGLYASFCFLLSFLFLDKKWSGFTIFPFFASISMLNFTISASRTSLLGLIMVILTLSYLGWRLRAVLLVFIAVAIPLFLLTTDNLDLIVQHFFIRGSESERYAGTFVIPLHAAFDNMLIPYGPSAGELVRNKYSSPLDCGYLWFLLAGGVVPFFLYIYFVTCVIRDIAKSNWRYFLPNNEKIGFYVQTAVLVYAFVFMIFEGNLRNILGWGDFIFLISLIGIYSSKESA